MHYQVNRKQKQTKESLMFKPQTIMIVRCCLTTLWSSGLLEYVNVYWTTTVWMYTILKVKTDWRNFCLKVRQLWFNSPQGPSSVGFFPGTSAALHFPKTCFRGRLLSPNYLLIVHLYDPAIDCWLSLWTILTRTDSNDTNNRTQMKIMNHIW